jgi:hypothetical protein
MINGYRKAINQHFYSIRLEDIIKIVILKDGNQEV